RTLPGLLAAPDAAARDQLFAAWLKAVGEPEPCDPCAAVAEEPHLTARLDWIETLTPELKESLLAIYERRFQGDDRFFVASAPRVANPELTAELDYAALTEVDAGYRLLAVFRLWNIIEYYFPYRDVIDEDWGEVLVDTIPRVLAADTKDAYQLEMLRFIARIDDGHSQLWSADPLRPPVGECQLPVVTRFIEGLPAVVQLADGVDAAASALRPGDAISALDGAAVGDLVESWLPFYPGSNLTHRKTGIARNLTRGACGPVTVTVDRGGEQMEIKTERIGDVEPTRYAHDRPGDVFQRLSDDVAYLKLTGVSGAEVDKYLEGAAGSKGLVIDIRNYPSSFMVFALGQRLIEEKVDFATIT
ncbi:MAG: hypothetical protein AAFY88_30880, partial [Acidobacteriota bacterium]